MLRKPLHGWRISREIRKLTALCKSSPGLNTPGSATRPTPLTSLSPLPPLFFYCRNFPPTSRFRFTHRITKFPLCASYLTTAPPSAAAYRFRAPEPEYLSLNVGSLRESFDDRREYDGDGEGFGRRRMPRRRRTLPVERVLIFTCKSKGGKCRVYCFWINRNSQELSRQEAMVVNYLERNVIAFEICPIGLDMVERMKRNPKVVNQLEVHPGAMYDVVMEQIRKYGGLTLSEQVANKLELYLGHQFRVAYEEAMKYGVRKMLRDLFPVQVALCDRRPLSEKISSIRASILFEGCDLVAGPWNRRWVRKRRFAPARFSCLWRLCVLQLLEWIQSGTYFGRKKRNDTVLSDNL